MSSSLVLKKALTLYHTTLRNVATFTSLSIAIYGYLKVFKSNKNVYILLTCISLLFLCIALSINILYMQYLNENKDDESIHIGMKWELILYVILLALLMLIGFGVYSLKQLL